MNVRRTSCLGGNTVVALIVSSSLTTFALSCCRNTSKCQHLDFHLISRAVHRFIERYEAFKMTLVQPHFTVCRPRWTRSSLPIPQSSQPIACHGDGTEKIRERRHHNGARTGLTQAYFAKRVSSHRDSIPRKWKTQPPAVAASGRSHKRLVQN